MAPSATVRFRRLRDPRAIRGAIFFFAALLALAAAYGPLLETLNVVLRDAVMRAHASASQETRIAVVDIDETSIAQLGPWPWPRERLADLIELLLARHGVRAVGLDMVLPEAADAPGDARLAALAEHGPLALAVAFDFGMRHPPLRQGSVGAGKPPAVDGVAVAATGHLGNHAGLAMARCSGNIGFVPDADGALRRLPARVRYAGADYPPLVTSMAVCAAGMTGPNLDRPILHVDSGGFWHLLFRHRFESYTVVSAADVLTDRLPTGLLAERFVLIGSSALGLADRVATPLSPSVSGVMVHAAALSDLLDATEGRLPASWPAFGIFSTWLAISLILLWSMLPRLSPWGALVLLACLSGAWSVIAWFALPRAPELKVVAPFVAYLAVLALAMPYEWWRARRESQQLIEMLSHYVAPAVLDEIMRRRPDFEPLTPQFREVTVLIADMEGYTHQTAALTLNEAARLTTEFLDCLTRPILATGGTLDKYTGDGVVAFWGAPLPIPDHADRALAAARDIVSSVADFSLSRQSRGLPPVRVRIGIESGTALVGDLGTAFRSTYTAVGDCINFAAKLEEAARDLAVDIVVGPGARTRLGNNDCLRSLGHLRLNDLTLVCWTPVT